MRRETRPYDAVKRVLDVTLACAVLAITAVPQAVIAGVIRLRLGPPVLFRQPRPGRDGVVFELVKFRTMLPPAPGLMTDEERLTPLGRFLRSTSLDELPTLINVVRGDMSLVGPRPLLVAYLPRYTAEQARRHEVRPGVTGLAQVAGRNRVAWDERFQLDVDYVDRRSLLLDARILLATVHTVLTRRGIGAQGEATMSEFRGATQETSCC